MSASPIVKLSDPPNATDLLHAAQTLAPEERRHIVEETLRQMPSHEQHDIAQHFRPGRATTDWIWLIVVSAFAAVLVGSFATLAISVFVGSPGAASTEMILTVFTSVVGFLAGLFAPSPLNKHGGD